MWFAGIDWADDHHDLVVLDDHGRQLRTLRVAHTPAGLAQLTAALEQLCGPNAKPQLACFVQTNRGLLIAALLEAGVAVYPITPKTVDRRRNAAGVKTDHIDAYLLAKTGRSDLADLRRLIPDSPLVQELKALTRDQDGLIQSQTRLLNQLSACLKADYPVALELFSKLHQPSTIAFLRAYPTPQQAVTASADAIAAVLKQAGYTRAAQAASAIDQKLQQPHVAADPITSRTKARLMLALLHQLQPVMEQIAAYDEEIERLFLTHADSALFASLPRAGKRLAPRLLAEISDARALRGCRQLGSTGGDGAGTLSEWDLCQSASAACLCGPLAECPAALCLAIDLAGAVGTGVRAAQALRRKKPHGCHPDAGECLAADHLCHVARPYARRERDL
jgi:transposase